MNTRNRWVFTCCASAVIIAASACLAQAESISDERAHALVTHVLSQLDRVWTAYGTEDPGGSLGRPGARVVWRQRIGSKAAGFAVGHRGVCWVAGEDGSISSISAQNGARRVVWRGAEKQNTSLAVSNTKVAIVQTPSLGRGHFSVVDARSGTLVAQSKLPIRPTHPVVTDGHGLFFIASKRGLIAISERGTILWQQKTSSSITGSPTVHCRAQGSCLVILGTRGDDVIAYDAAHGRLVWEHDLHSNIDAPITAVGETIFAATRKGDIHALHTQSGTPRWKAHIGKMPDMRVANAGHGNVVAVTKKGSAHIWNAKSGALISSWEAGDQVGASPVVVGDELITVGKDGRVEAWSLRSNGKRSRQWSLEGSAWTQSPTITHTPQGPTLCILNTHGQLAGLTGGG